MLIAVLYLVLLKPNKLFAPLRVLIIWGYISWYRIKLDNLLNYSLAPELIPHTRHKMRLPYLTHYFTPRTKLALTLYDVR